MRIASILLYEGIGQPSEFFPMQVLMQLAVMGIASIRDFWPRWWVRYYISLGGNSDISISSGGI